MINSAVKATGAAFIMLLAVTNTVSAQDRAEAGAVKMTDKMKTELTLTDAQYPKVLEVNKEFVTKTMETKKTVALATTDAAADKTARLERANAVKALNEQKEAKLKAILTEDQYKTYLAKKEEKQARLQARRAENKVFRANGSMAPSKDAVAPAPATTVKKS